VTLEFTKVVDQVQRMGRYLGKRDQTIANRLELALERFYQLTELEPVHERIKLVRESSVSGYRGAAPSPRPYDEIICGVGPLPEAPPLATVIAADGSQVYPDPHAPALYYMINIGLFVYYHGETRVPLQLTNPELFYSDKMLLDRDGRVITNQTVNARRSVMEMEWLAKQAWTQAQDMHSNGHEPRPLITLYDGNLLKFFGANEVAGAQEIENDYMEALQRLYDSGALLAAYAEKSRSTSLISLLHLMSLAPQQVNDANLKTNGELEGLSDATLFGYVLEPGARSAIMVQNSPQNHEYKVRKGPEYEIGFFYINVSTTNYPIIIRLEIPMWVAYNALAVDVLHALVVQQCGIQGRKHYPYVLTRADEMAYVSSLEKQQLEELIRIEMMKNRVAPEQSNKLQTKGLARGQARRQHRLRVS
jgi:hypothetical protein